MTMDHIIPISRGGKNEAENMIALCESCNKEKGNILYLPLSFYMAMEGKPELNKMQRYVEDWFDTVKDQFDISTFPLIAPKTNQQIKLLNAKHTVYQPQLIVQWRIVNRNYYEEIEAVTGLNTKFLRMSIVNELGNAGENQEGVPKAAIYSLRKITSDKILALAVVKLYEKRHHMTIWFPWCDMSKKWQANILMQFIRRLLYCVTKMAGIEILTYSVHCCEESMLDGFTKSKYMDRFTAYAYTPMAEGSLSAYAIHVERYDHSGEIRGFFKEKIKKG